MRAYRVEKVIAPDGTIQLEELPFLPGDIVEIIVLARKELDIEDFNYPLAGTVTKYEDPTEPVALEDWEALQ